MALSNIISGIQKGTAGAGGIISRASNNLINTAARISNIGSGIANAASAQGQANQFAYNSAEAVAQREYNTEMWDKNAAYNSAEASIAREFNAAEAAKNRKWQEYMSSTAYQRAVADLKKAGLNPVLAAFGSGASVGTGASASGAAATSSPASSSAASGSGYQGVGHEMNGTLAMCGVIGSIIGDGLSALAVLLNDQENGKIQQIYNTMETGYNNLKDDLHRTPEERWNYKEQKMREYGERYYQEHPNAYGGRPRTDKFR